MDVTHAFYTLDQVGRTTSRREKELLLRAAGNNKYLRRILQLAYDPYVRYGIGSVHANKPPIRFYSEFDFGGLVDNHQSLNDDEIFIRYLEAIGDGNAASDDDVAVFRKFLWWCFISWDGQVSDIVKYVAGIVQKDLRCGISYKTINKIFPNLIPVFEVQLAEPFDQYITEAIVEPKFDGVRCIALLDKDKNSVSLFTRDGMPIYGYNEVNEELHEIMQSLDCSMMLDGELISKNFDQTMEGLFAKGTGKTATYMLFDCMKLHEFLSVKCSVKLIYRKLQLSTIADTKSVVKVDYAIRDVNSDNIASITDEYISRGYEGAMAKDPESMYSFKRDMAWQKIKRFHTIDCLITGFSYGTGRNEDVCGAINVEFSIVNGKPVNYSEDLPKGKSEVGSGFDDATRLSIANKFNEYYKGKICEIKFQELTRHNSLRFPVWIRLRKDKSNL